MAKGYPTPVADEGYPILDDVLAEGTCMICKRRPAVTARGECAECDAKLHQGDVTA